MSENIPSYMKDDYSINNPGNVSGTITNSSVKTYDYTIRGQAFHSSFELNSFESMNKGLDEDYIKRLLCERLVEEMMKCNHIEFTRQIKNIDVDDSYIYRARIFSVPDNQVRILRSLKEIQ